MIRTCTIVIASLHNVSNLEIFANSELLKNHVCVSKKLDFLIIIPLVLLILNLKHSYYNTHLLDVADEELRQKILTYHLQFLKSCMFCYQSLT